MQATLIIRLFALYLTVETVLCIFYTSSKEKDYPRIGKRRDVLKGDQLWTDEISDINQKTSDFQLGTTKHQIFSPVSPTLYFKLFDKDGDGCVSQQEFYTSWNKQIRRLIKSLYDLEK